MDTEFESIATRFSRSLRERTRELDQARAEGASPATSRRPSRDPVTGKITPIDRTLAPTPAADALSALIARAEEQAALCGAFAPQDVLPADLDEETRQRALSALSAECFIEPRRENTRWLLLADARKAALKRMKKEGRLRSRLEAGALPQTDAFGETLREVIEKGAGAPLNRSLPQLLHLIRAIDALAPAQLGPLPDRHAVRRGIGQAAFRAEADTLIGHGFFGRDEELKSLHRFVKDTERPNDVLVVTGMGGAGKSTLLMRFLKSLLDQNEIPVSLLDFDRPGIKPNDTDYLELELSRHVGYQIAGVDAALQEARRAGRVKGTTRGVIAQLRRGLEGKRKASLLLVLDTFEQVIERDLAPKILDWLGDLAIALAPVRLKVIIAGRLFDRALEALRGSMTREPMLLDALAPAHAAQLLERLEVSADRAAWIANSDLIPHRPLELRLLARLLAEQPDTDLTRIEQELREGGPLAAELFSGIVYRRVLQCLPDTRAGQLAYPGLILRFITPEILCEVLVPALGLAPMEEGQARGMLDELARHDWLVTRDANGALWHRRDLRRATLSAMIAKERELATRIHRQAIEYFSAREDGQAEAVYHRLMLAGSEGAHLNIDLRAIREVASDVRGDAADWPAAGRALFRYATEEVLSIEELPLLPLVLRAEAYQRLGERLLRAREFGQAWTLISRRDALLKVPATRQPGSISTLWEIETAFATAHWDVLEGVSWPVSNWSEACASLYFSELTTFNWDPVPRLRTLLSSDGPAFRQAVAGAHDAELRRLAVAIVMQPNLGDSEALRRRLYDLEDPMKHQRVSPALQRRWPMARRALGHREAITLTLIPAFVCLQRSWLRYFNEDHRGFDADVRSRSLVRKVERVMTMRRPTARRLLTEIDGLLGARSAGASSNLPQVRLGRGAPSETLRYLLSGPNPELRDPARFALLDAFSGEAGFTRLARLLQAQLDVSLVEFESGQFVIDMAQDAERTLEPYIELVDRSWRLGRLLSAAVACVDPPASALIQVCASHEQWERAVRRALGGTDDESTSTDDTSNH